MLESAPVTRSSPKRGSAKSQPTAIAIDTGGTFTDCVWIERGKLRMLKVFSTPADPSRAIAAAIKQTKISDPVLLLHGTTVGTNTVLERKGARVAFVTTRGFEDSIEIGRQNRPKLYDFFFDRIPPLVPEELRFGVHERTSAQGDILRAPSEDELNELLSKIKAGRPQAIAISLLFAFANRQYEEKVASRLQRLRVPLSISHKILPEFREYERASTVVMNAYLQPIVQRYLEGLRRRTKRTRIFVMQSSGGLASLESAAHEPVRTVLSGPAGGVVGAAAAARHSGYQRIIAFDMGGTSTDVSLVDGAPQATSEGELAGLPVRVPMLDIHTVGAGGGSLARFDAGGALRVGPESAGADPGPICYGRGAQPTVTDANLLLGRLRPEQFLGGDFRLNLARARNLVKRWLQQNTSKLSAEEFAAGVVRVVNANMERALRVVSIERGHDPRDFTLVAFGGAGGLHACELAMAMGIPRVIVPALPGALSAFGILISDVIKDYSRTVLWRIQGNRLSNNQVAALRAEFAVFEQRARDDFRAEGWEAPKRLERTADLRYRGQGFELNVAVDARGERFIEDFHREHQRRYGYSHRNEKKEIEIVTLRLRATVPSLSRAHSHIESPTAPLKAGKSENVFFDAKPISSAIHPRDSLRAKKSYQGPAIVTEYSATTVIPPGLRFQIDEASNLIINCKK